MTLKHSPGCACCGCNIFDITNLLGFRFGTLTTRTDANTGTLTMAAAHGIATADVVAINWSEGDRSNVPVGTVAGNSVPISSGSSFGDVLPLVTTAITAMVRRVGTLTTRTDRNTGTLTMSPGHGITTGETIDIRWGSLNRYNVVVGTVAGNSVPIDFGTGDILPLAASAITAVVRKTGTLTTRTNDTNGTLTLATGHGVVSFETIDIRWIGGTQSSVIAGTVAGLSIPFDLGAGDDLPITTTVISVQPVLSTTPDVEVTGAVRKIIKTLLRDYWILRFRASTITSIPRPKSGSVRFRICREDDTEFATIDFIYGSTPDEKLGGGTMIVSLNIAGSTPQHSFTAGYNLDSSGGFWLAMRPEGLITNAGYTVYDPIDIITSTKPIDSQFTGTLLPMDPDELPANMYVTGQVTATLSTGLNVRVTADRIYVPLVYNCGYGYDGGIIQSERRPDCEHPVICGTFDPTFSTPRWQIGTEPDFDFVSVSPFRSKFFSGCNSISIDREERLTDSVASNKYVDHAALVYQCTDISSPAAYIAHPDLTRFFSRRLDCRIVATEDPCEWELLATLTIAGPLWQPAGAPAATTVVRPATNGWGGLVSGSDSNPCGVDPFKSAAFFGAAIPGSETVSTLIGSPQWVANRVEIKYRRLIPTFRVPPSITLTVANLDPAGFVGIAYFVDGFTLTGITYSSVTNRFTATMTADWFPVDTDLVTLNLIPDVETWMPQPFA